MANSNFDGSLTFDTELDSEGFEKGSKKLLNATESLARTVTHTGEKIGKSMESAAGSFQKMGEAAEETAARSGNAFEQKLAELDAKMKETLAAINELDEQSRKENASPGGEAKVAEFQRITAEYKRLTGILGELESQYQEVQLQAEQAAASSHTSFRKMVGSIHSYLREARKARLQSNSLARSLLSLKNMLIAKLKNLFLSALFENVQDGLQSLRKYYTAYDGAMTRMKAATQRAGGTIAIAIAHLVVTAEPYITRLINLLTSAIEKLNQFVSLLTGVKGIKVDEVSAYTEALEKADAAQEKLNADLYGFDQLNRQSENIGKTDSSSKGDSITYTEDEAQATNGWLEKIKENLPLITRLAAGVGAALATWKIGSGLMAALDPKGEKGLAGRLAGVALAIGGATVATLSFVDAWKNGISNANLLTYFGGGITMAGGLALAFQNLKAGMVGLAAVGIGGVVLGLKEWIQQGELTQKSFASLEGGIAALSVGLAGFTGGWSLLVGAVAAAGLAIYKNWDTIKLKFQELGQSLSEEGQRIKTVFQTGWAELQADFANIGVALQTFWQWIVTGITEFIGEIQILITNGWIMLQEIWNVIILGLQEVWLMITTGIQTFIMECQLLWQEMLLFIQTIWTSIATFFTNAWELMKTAATTAAQTIKTFVTTAWTEVQATTTAVFSAVKSFIQSAFTTIKTAMITAVQSAKTAVVAQWNALLASCKAIFQGVHTTVVTLIQQAASFLAGQSWYGYGVQLMQGFWNGLRSLMSAIWQSVCDFVRRCADAVRSALRIGSPSKVFEEIGQYTGEGFIVGLEDQQNAAVKTAENLADAVTNGMSDNVGVELTANGMQSVISNLTTVAGIFRTIAASIASIGGLSQPQVSAGSVVPYKTRVNSGTDAEDAHGVVATGLSDILAQLQRLVRNTEEGFSGTFIIPVSIDGREVFNVVVDQNNREIQRTGESPIRV